jgi:hypothetical protein
VTSENYFFAGAAGAAGAGAGAGAGAAAGAGAGAGAGASALGAAAGFCSSAFLQPTTANDNAAKKNREKITANTFFIETPPYNEIENYRGTPPIGFFHKSLFPPCQDIMSRKWLIRRQEIG